MAAADRGPPVLGRSLALPTGAFVAVMAATGLLGIPVAHPSAFATPTASSCLGDTTRVFPAHMLVSGIWKTGGGSVVDVSIAGPTGSPEYDQRGGSGAFSFSSVGGSYTFTVRPTGSSPGCEPVPPTGFSVSWSGPVV